ncbi:hypothetical protein NOVOSPHI9U_70158 [Novosphingobium sp. 9U]|nr:hypothetical protein NOVOSPHI9U_70158 [Novosphingobium sp. 9U]
MMPRFLIDEGEREMIGAAEGPVGADCLGAGGPYDGREWEALSLNTVILDSFQDSLCLVPDVTGVSRSCASPI